MHVQMLSGCLQNQHVLDKDRSRMKSRPDPSASSLKLFLHPITFKQIHIHGNITAVFNNWMK